MFVTHDRYEALNVGDRVAVLREGRVVQVDRPEIVYNRPCNCYVATFLGPATFLPARVERGGVVTEAGRLPQRVDAPEGARVEVMVRPDDVLLQPLEPARSPAVAGPAGDGPGGALGNALDERAGCGTVVSRERRDGFYLYSVRLASGTLISSELPHTHEYDPGDRVQVVLDPGHPLCCFRDGCLLQPGS
ncbi:MAG TPA: TOBE domain-containing protein [Bacillota bacterium]